MLAADPRGIDSAVDRGIAVRTHADRLPGVRSRRALPVRTALALAGVVAWAAHASPGEPPGDAGRDAVRLPRVTDPAWERVLLPGVEHETSYRPADDDALRAEADCAASARVVRVADVDLTRTPVLRWRWRVEEGLDNPDERTKKGDDFAARVSVLFPFEPDHAGWLESLRHRITGRLVGREVPGSALYFVWTDRIPPGSVWPNPYASEVSMRALERGPADGWRSEAVDVARGYREAFGRPPPPPAAVGIMTDSDNLCARAVALYADFRFTARDGPAP